MVEPYKTGGEGEGNDESQDEDQTRWSEKLLEMYESLHTTVLNSLPSLWNAFEFALSVKAILNIDGCTLPFAGIILGPPSSLKTVIIQLLKGRPNTFHTHSFSPKSFVSHSTAVKREELKNIDLLPKLKNKLLLTPELAPIFGARDEELLQTLSILTSVLDGHGFSNDTGAQGHRGYDEDTMFAWLGAVVEIQPRVHKQLSALGPKLYFYRLPKVEHNEDYYYNRRDQDFNNEILAINQALTEYLEFFESYPSIVFRNDDDSNELLKIPLDSSRDEEFAYRCIIRLGKLLAHLRAVVPTWETRDSQGSEYNFDIPIIEDPSRAITQLHNLAKGHALSQGRNHITIEDIPMVIQVVLSTCSILRAIIFDLLIENKGVLTTSKIVDNLNTSKPTALRTMTELKATSLVTMGDVNPGEYNSERVISLKPAFAWFLSDKFAELKEKGRCKEKYPPSASAITTTSNSDVSQVITDGDNSSSGDGGLRGHFSLHQNITTFACNYCEFETSDQDEYNNHSVMKHPRKAGYPDRNRRRPDC